MKRIIAAFALALSLSAPAAALTIPAEDVRGYKYAANGYGFGYSYEISLIEDILHIDVDLLLFGATQGIEGLVSRWERGIESIWSTADRFAVPILFNVDFVFSGAYDLPVRIAEGYGRWNTSTWYSGRADDNHERAAAHEFGHFLGRPDEYVGGAVIDGVVNTGGLMHTLSGPTLSYYYEDFLNWYEAKLDLYGGSEGPAPVPEPGTVLLLGVGLVLVAVRMKRREV